MLFYHTHGKIFEAFPILILRKEEIGKEDSTSQSNQVCPVAHDDTE